LITFGSAEIDQSCNLFLSGNMLFQSYMVEDRGSGGASYVDFLVSVHRQIQHKLNW